MTSTSCACCSPAHPSRGPGHLLALGPARSVGLGALCVDPVLVCEAVEVGDASAVAAVESVAGPLRR